MEFKTTSLIVAEANHFLDNLRKPITIQEVESNLSYLSDLKDMMLRNEFSTRFNVTPTHSDVEELSGEDKAELKRQLRIFRDFSNLKRYSLNRVRVAIASHKILYNMLKRNRVYPVADYFPYNGSYLRDLILYGEPTVKAYSSILRIISMPSKEEISGFVVTVEHPQGKERLVLTSTQNLEEKIKKAYGQDAVITSIARRKLSPPIIGKQSMRIAVATGYSIYATRKIIKELENKELNVTEANTEAIEIGSTGINCMKKTEENKYQKKQGEDPENNKNKMNTKYKEYVNILQQYGLSPDTRIDLFEGHLTLKDILFSKNLIDNIEGPINLDTDVERVITEKRAEYSSKVVNEANLAFAFDVFSFFLTESRRTRSTYPLFQGISADFKECYSFLSTLRPVINCDPFSVLKEKIELEKITNVRSDLVGLSCLHIHGVSIQWCAKNFNINENELETALKELKPYLEQIKNKKRTSKKSQQFVELIKKMK